MFEQLRCSRYTSCANQFVAQRRAGRLGVLELLRLALERARELRQQLPVVDRALVEHDLATHVEKTPVKWNTPCTSSLRSAEPLSAADVAALETLGSSILSLLALRLVISSSASCSFEIYELSADACVVRPAMSPPRMKTLGAHAVVITVEKLVRCCLD
ncbi:hypothetical protein PF010_g17730 [Phytophthora fragariae]|uniref:Uncharacterized protein n=1 Tax=Phytophthora fragariae TaxID=53985 RepID=A0A6A3SV90_9STRA|nr:hypothetical protein PF003_g38959 [Phytophthora fragariae]KAE8930563.1 hypothetical protein PF009_g19351 [Phytophthora fragariae]KAE8989185.1 hypothetical protein PF011_g18876 [Phytophthora fragariae]KAE9092725.1 hypothetical protein PF007_g18377 [Phytophthora fragariae]KAE9092752.1 hypothetical protein PF010_g17730 [Phytophthora fragariae]